ncbi:hypothetical protein RI367_004683 [Sorochytrium milnesiophthora]
MGSTDIVQEFTVLQAQYTELRELFKDLESDYQSLKTGFQTLKQQKADAESELVKMRTVKDKLEDVARALTKENKRLKTDMSKFQNIEGRLQETLNDQLEFMMEEVVKKVVQDGEKRRVEETDSQVAQLHEKLQSFMEQYNTREAHFASVLKSKDLELAIYRAKFEKTGLALAEKQGHGMRLEHQIVEFKKTEEELRRQLSTYVDKFRQVEDTLSKSNELFTTFREEMELLTRKTKKLEKENDASRSKCERLNATLILMNDIQARHVKTIDTLTAQKSKLESLCRALQAERKQMRAELAHLRVVYDYDSDFGPDDDYDELPTKKIVLKRQTGDESSNSQCDCDEHTASDSATDLLATPADK